MASPVSFTIPPPGGEPVRDKAPLFVSRTTRVIEPPDRYHVEIESSNGEDGEWVAFVREDAGDPLRHVGSVRAQSADEAYALAVRLFAWYANEIWVCPVEAVTRYTADAGDADDGPVTIRDREESRTHEL